MDNKMLISKLREISRSASPYKKQLIRQAARRIEEQAAVLEKTRHLLKPLEKALPAMDAACDFCDYNISMRPCVEKDELFQCKECPYGCACQDCGPEGSKWENSILQEVLREVKG